MTLRRLAPIVVLSGILAACGLGHRQPSGFINVGGVEVPDDQVPVSSGGTALTMTYAVTQPPTGCGVDGSLQCHQTAQISYTDEDGITQQVTADTPWSLTVNMPPGASASLTVSNYYDSDTSPMTCAIEEGATTLAGPKTEYGGDTASCSTALP